MIQKKRIIITRNLILFGILLLLHLQTSSVSGSISATAGPYLASANENNTGWMAPTRLYVAAGPASVAEADGDSVTIYNFGIVDLGGVTIDGIVVRVNAGTYQTDELGTVTVVLLYDGRSTPALESKTTPDIPSLYTDYYLGGATDKWGETSWSTDSFTNASFGLKLVANGPLDTNKYIGVQFVQVTVYYTGALSEIQPTMIIIIPFIIGVTIILKRRKLLG